MRRPGFRRTDCSSPEPEAAAAARQVDSGCPAWQGDALHASAGDSAAAPSDSDARASTWKPYTRAGYCRCPAVIWSMPCRGCKAGHG